MHTEDLTFRVVLQLPWLCGTEPYGLNDTPSHKFYDRSLKHPKIAY